MAFPNFHDNPELFNRVKLGGVLIQAALVEIDGIKIEAEWSEQRATGTSGPTWVFKGMKAAGPHKLTFETGVAAGVTPSAMFADLRDLYERFGPTAIPVGGAATPGSKGDPYTGQGSAPNATSTGSTVPTTAGGDKTTDASGFPKSAGVSPGPRPPTLTVENAFLAYVGTTAVSLKSWEVKPTATNSIRCVVELIPQKAPTKAGTGVAPAAKGDAFTAGAQSKDGTPVQKADTAAAQAGAGT